MIVSVTSSGGSDGIIMIVTLVFVFLFTGELLAYYVSNCTVVDWNGWRSFDLASELIAAIPGVL